ncbi:lytic polysaccharide monooxygenase [Hebeloma cylindrosporum]|uniref:lytic cellulose monooxygenase (C4-dehydrogenating) n=1 Tax=Hebeloma cylindrosporum TaxID=76867 RepID=A0A0C2XEH9_HEBCY|nr:lytic polysaccharide monooxygenase [Hebeloma cylindrosporum h7]
MKTTSLLFPLLTAAYVSAHGFLSTVTINGKAFSGNRPSGNKGPSVIRQVSSPNPNKGAQNPALTCGPNASAGSLVADANPGDTVTFDWRGADLSKWPHNTGPMLTYLASCGSTTCDKFNPANAKWFKIQQIGRKNGNGDWAQADLMTGGVASATIPSNLAPGNYMIRHEIIALHLATSFNGAEFYPGCAQLRVGGSQTGVPKASDLVSLPGAYSDNDPGIFDPSVFNNNAKYVFPGPAIASFVSGTSSNGGGSGSTPTTTSGSTPTKAPTKSCKIKKRAATSDEQNLVVRRPRHVSRIMRRLAFGESIH